MQNWYHLLKGSFNIGDETIRLDFGSHIGDQIQLAATLVHETTHAALANMEFGQATKNAYHVIPRTKDLSEKEQVEVMRLLTLGSQDFVQEGLATLMQFLWLTQEMSKKDVLDLAEKILPPEYLDKLREMYFVFDLSPRYRDEFTKKASTLSMETGIRRVAPSLDLFRSAATLRQYLSEADNNPNERLRKIIKTIKHRTWLVTKPIEEIAAQSGITFHPPTSKKDVAAFLTYMASRMGAPREYTEAEIGDTPDSDEFFRSIAEDVVVGNLNQRFSGQAEIIFKLDDFLYYSDVAETIFITPYRDTDEERDRLTPLIGETPEIVLAMIASTGAKYVTAVSRDTAERILKSELRSATLLTKAGAFDSATNQMIESPTFRHPDFVIYNTAKSLLPVLENFSKAHPEARFSHFYASAMEGHILRTLYVKIEGQVPIYAVNALGGGDIDRILELIKEKSRQITEDELRTDKNHYNNYSAFWMGMHREVDWIETMLDPGKKHLYFRDGRVLDVPTTVKA